MEIFKFNVIIQSIRLNSELNVVNSRALIKNNAQKVVAGYSFEYIAMSFRCSWNIHIRYAHRLESQHRKPNQIERFRLN